MKGSSRTNLLYMRAFAEAWRDEAIVQQVAGQIPWFHNCVLLDKLKSSLPTVEQLETELARHDPMDTVEDPDLSF